MSDFVLEVSAWLGAIINRVFCSSGSLKVGYMYPHMHTTPQHTFDSYLLVCPVDTNLEPVVMNFRPCQAQPVQQPVLSKASCDCATCGRSFRLAVRWSFPGRISGPVHLVLVFGLSCVCLVPGLSAILVTQSRLTWWGWPLDVYSMPPIQATPR